MKPAALLSVAFLLIIALAHLLRVAFSVPITVGEFSVPMWPSMLAFVGPGALALWLWRETRTVPR